MDNRSIEVNLFHCCQVCLSFLLYFECPFKSHLYRLNVSVKITSIKLKDFYGTFSFLNRKTMLIYKNFRPKFSAPKTNKKFNFESHWKHNEL